MSSSSSSIPTPVADISFYAACRNNDTATMKIIRDETDMSPGELSAEITEAFYMTCSENLHVSLNFLLSITKTRLYGGDMREGILSSCSNNSSDVFRILVKHLHSRQIFMSMVDECLMIACQHGHLETLLVILANSRPDINKGLLTASGRGKWRLIKPLIDAGAENFQDSIIVAGLNDHLDAVRTLAPYADVNDALWHGSFKMSFKIIKSLLIYTGSFPSFGIPRKLTNDEYFQLFKLNIQPSNAEQQVLNLYRRVQAATVRACEDIGIPSSLIDIITKY